MSVRRCSGVRDALAIATGLLGLATAHGAHAGGLYVADRGVEPLGRGGAVVAGVEDQHAVWYNPAGLALAGSGFLLDATYINSVNQYRREVQIPGSANVEHLDAVSGSPTPLPIPTLVVSHNFGLRNWNFALGLMAPDALLNAYPETSTAPQRYSLYNMNGSVLIQTGLWAAWAPSPQFAIGLGVSALVGSFNARVALSACPATITCQPEDPSWDAVAQISASPIFAPTGNVGVRWAPSPFVVFGASFAAPVYVDSPAQLQVRLPSAAYFDGASVQGDRASVAFWLPPIVRVGIEVRPTEHLRIEADFVAEFWSVHQQISLVPNVDDAQPGGIEITNVLGVGTYHIGPTAIQRGFQNSYSAHVGGEYRIDAGHGWNVTPRLGFVYETSATPIDYTSVLTQDADKIITAIGLSVGNRHWRVDATYAHVYTPTVAVAATDGQLYQVAPFRQNDQAPVHAINGGQYDMALNLFGLGLRYTF